MDFKNQMDKKIILVENRLKQLLKNAYPDQIFNAMNYSVFAGGKRLRPLLVLGACEAVGGEPADALDFACAIEMIHTYSLIHDDLPCMDDDCLRRGKPTNHVVFGYATALLAGDGLLNFAYETMCCAVLKNCNERTVSAMNEIAKSAGVFGMIGGQVVDMEYEEKEADEKALEYIHKHKTGALIKAAVLAGAMIGGASEHQLKILEEAAYKLGFAFQIKDDILDVTSTIEELGKTVGSDVKNKKTTYVSLHGLEKSKGDYDLLSQEAYEKFARAVQNQSSSEIKESDVFLLNLVKELTNRKK